MYQQYCSSSLEYETIAKLLIVALGEFCFCMIADYKRQKCAKIMFSTLYHGRRIRWYYTQNTHAAIMLMMSSTLNNILELFNLWPQNTCSLSVITNKTDCKCEWIQYFIVLVLVLLDSIHMLMFCYFDLGFSSLTLIFLN